MLDASTPPEELLAAWLRPQARGIAPVNEQVCIGTRTGTERTANQDRSLVAQFGDVLSGLVEVFVVCDGMGGMVEGGACAERGIASFVLALVRLMRGGQPPHSALFESVQEANRRVFDLYGGRGGTTLAALVRHRGTVSAACVGDSRLMLVRNDGSSAQLSRDDTMRGALDALGHVPVDRSPEHDRLVQFVGMGRDLQPQVFPVVELQNCRFLILVTDGAYRLGGDLVLGVLKHASSPKQFVERVLRMADWLGGADDASLIAVTGQSLQVGAKGESGGVLRVWGPSQQQLALWLPKYEGRRLTDQRKLEAPVEVAAPSPPVRPKRESRNKKPPRSRKGRPQEPLPLPESLELIIDLGVDAPTSAKPHAEGERGTNTGSEPAITTPDGLTADAGRRYGDES